jgi:hypothetical protein
MVTQWAQGFCRLRKLQTHKAGAQESAWGTLRRLPGGGDVREGQEGHSRWKNQAMHGPMGERSLPCPGDAELVPWARRVTWSRT